MKVLLDTSYLLPLIKVEVHGISSSILTDLINRNDTEIFYSEISLFEITAKGMKLILSGENLSIHDIRSGIDSLLWNKKILRLGWANHPLLLELSLSLRKIHQDYIDCLILATSICYTDIFITFDKEMYNKIVGDQSIIEEIFKINSKFQFWFRNLSDKPKSLKKT